MWKDIDVAPRDGVVLLALDDLGHPHLVWGDERGFFNRDSGDQRFDLRFWMLIPTLP